MSPLPVLSLNAISLPLLIAMKINIIATSTRAPDRTRKSMLNGWNANRNVRVDRKKLYVAETSNIREVKSRKQENNTSFIGILNASYYLNNSLSGLKILGLIIA